MYILDKITCRILDNDDIDYYVNDELMDCFDNIYTDMNKIENFVTRE